MVVMSLDELIQNYFDYVQTLGDMAEAIDIDAMFSLIDRDILFEKWNDLDEKQRQLVKEIDKLLIQKRNLIARILPTPSSTDANRQAGRWWWFFDVLNHAPRTGGDV